MTDTLSAQQNGIIEIHICWGAIAKSLAGMENERDVKPQFLLAFTKLEERFNIVD